MAVKYARAAGLAAAAFIVSPAGAAPLKGEAELGVVLTQGNAESQSLSAKLGTLKEYGSWRHSGRLEAINNSSRNVTSAERYLAFAKSDYKFSDREYLFAALQYEADRFSGFDYRASETVGYGRRLIERPTLTLDAEVGPGARQSKPTGGETGNELIGRLGGHLVWIISPTSQLTEDLSVEAGDDATITRSVTAIKTQMMARLAMKLSYTLKNTSEVPPGVEKTDTETVVTLVYNF